MASDARYLLAVEIGNHHRRAGLVLLGHHPEGGGTHLSVALAENAPPGARQDRLADRITALLDDLPADAHVTAVLGGTHVGAIAVRNLERRIRSRRPKAVCRTFVTNTRGVSAAYHAGQRLHLAEIAAATVATLEDGRLHLSALASAEGLSRALRSYDPARDTDEWGLDRWGGPAGEIVVPLMAAVYFAARTRPAAIHNPADVRLIRDGTGNIIGLANTAGDNPRPQNYSSWPPTAAEVARHPVSGQRAPTVVPVVTPMRN